MTDDAFKSWMSRPGPPDTVDGEVVMRGMAQLRMRFDDLERIKQLGEVVEVSTRRGLRRHTCTVVAVYEHADPMNGNRETWHWLNDEARKVHAKTPQWKRERYGGVRILRIDASTCPNMVGMYLNR